MKKIIVASVLLFVVSVLQSQVFAASTSLKCKFKDDVVEGVETIEISDETLKINSDLHIPLEKSTIRCANLGRQKRFDGYALGYQVVLESCSTGGALEGDLIDAVKGVSAPVVCDSL